MTPTTTLAVSAFAAVTLLIALLGDSFMVQLATQVLVLWSFGLS